MTGATVSARLSQVDRLRLATEILLAYGEVRWSLRRDSLPGVVATLRSAPLASNVGVILLPDPSLDGQRLGDAVVRTLSPVPSAARCLLRSLLLLRLLARRGIHGALVIAVQPNDEAALDAHAWVEIDGRPLLAPAPSYGRLVTL
jgi:Transglutaminase-like superfamily